MSSLLERGFTIDLPLSATHRLLAELARCGYVRQARTQGDYVRTIKLGSLFRRSA